MRRPALFRLRHNPSGRRGTVLRIGGILLGALLSGCDTPPPAAVKTGATSAQVERGRAVYNFRCYFCHGYSGDAQTLAATYLTPAPRNFQSATADELPPARILAAVRDGRPGTAMKGFRDILPERDLEAVAAFVHDEFVVRKARNTRYHTPENGWPDHARYADAFPFARGEIALTVPVEDLDPTQRRGRALYLDSCVSCHDRGRPAPDPVIWEGRPVSYPRAGYDHRRPEIDAAASATPYRIHDTPPRLTGPTAAQKRGEKLFQDNCAFCHAADGTGKNWIGSFLEPHPRNLTDPAFAGVATDARLRTAIQNGLKDTSMPAWKHVLTDKQIDDVIAYVNSAFIGPNRRAAP